MFSKRITMEDGKRKLDKIKDHFQSFVKTFESKSSVTSINLLTTDKDGKEACPSKDSKETDNKTRKITDPRDKEAYYERVMTWFAKPKDLSPLECARYGWKNIDVDMLECVSCKAKLCGKLPDGNLGHEYYEKLKLKIISAHEKCCLWWSSPSPVSFTTVEFHDKKGVMNEFTVRLKRLLALKSQLPQLSYKHFTEQDFDEDKLNNLILEYQHGLGQEESVDLTFTIIKTSLLLAICGWKVSDKLTTVLTCSYCNRHIGIWNYKKVDTEDNGDTSSATAGSDKNTCDNGTTKSPSTSPSKDASISATMSSANGIGSPSRDVSDSVAMLSANGGSSPSMEKNDNNIPSKRLRMEEKHFFDPVEEHSYWCPWIVDSGGDKSVQSPVLRSSNDSFDSSFDSHHNASTTAWIQMFKMVFPAMVNSDSQATSLSYYFKHKSPVRGIRILRNMLNSWCSPNFPPKQES
ncbi:hypothetical protein KUTeg_020748 [Tegillarca granosa]|uniref:Nuclear-interacting partner of ALK n=1 Tax=Tegillarca granosa TaxID=220873 RepID=A0ABQ9E8U1_TEGGR|nr:hypothetical protein KUTeg_020748 [Tegillarca granosa]